MIANTPDDWHAWLNSFRKQFIAAQGSGQKEVKLRIRDAWVVVRDGRVHNLTGGGQRPEDAIPIFETLTFGSWKRPIEITDRLTGLIAKAMASQRSPRDIVLGLLSQVEHAEGPDESAEIKQKRDKAAFWIWQLLDACEDGALSAVAKSDVFWQAILYALEAGRWLTILDLYRNPQALTDLVKAQAFQAGRKPDEVSRHLEASYEEQCAKLGRDPKPREVAEAAGGKWSNADACWQFGTQLLSHDALCQRLKDIRHRRPA